MIQLTLKEKEMLIIGLRMRRNYIETGDIGASAADIEKIGGKDTKINALSIDQMQLIIDMEKLVTKLYNPE